VSISNYGTLLVVNTSTAGDQFQATVAGLASGKILVMWYDVHAQTLAARYFDALGNPFGAEGGVFVTSAGATSTQLPRLAAAADGGYTYGYVGVSGAAQNVGFIVANSDGMQVAGTGTSAFDPGVRSFMVDKGIGGSGDVNCYVSGRKGLRFPAFCFHE
jgi:hypothetical protein